MDLLQPSVPRQRIVNVGVSVIASAALIAVLYYGRAFFVTLIVSGILAAVLDPAVQLVTRLRLPRPAATGVVIGVALLAAYLLGAVMWAQFSTLAQDLPTYASRVSELLDKTSAKLDDMENRSLAMVIPQRWREQEQEIQQKPREAAQARKRRAGANVTPPSAATPAPIPEVRIRPEPKPAISYLYDYVSLYFSALLMASFVPFLVFFMLSWRDHFRKSVVNLFHGEQRYAVEKTWKNLADATRAFALGNFVLGILLSAVSATAFFFLRVPYWPLVGVISGFFSLFPYLGLPLAVAPPVLAALAIPNKLTVILSIAGVAAGLHLIALNVLYPKVVGRHVHLNPLVVTVALMFWTLLWGGIGLILAVPLTAAIKAVCENVETLRPVARLLSD